MKKQTYNTKEKLNAFERGIIKDAISRSLLEWEAQLIESESNKKQISLFHPSFPMQVYREIERKLNLTEL
jgi:hypothetical protein